ncbi:HAD family phosphatase [Bullifex sp.]|uniref:HAD family hydrolase n=1 Tax=Bullifex sp. TaxID=2815808 RepID=UPI002A82BBD9|nr:HAD family phosphatase [Bullifex sp.]MDY4067519.1 HAD family phosphatase [Bullifex sp.]
MIKGIIFDLDGTLLDSMDLWVRIDKEFLKKRGLEYTQDYSKAITAMEITETAIYTINRYNLKESVSEVISEWKEMAINEYKNSINLKEGVTNFLNHLKEKGIKIAIATSSSKDFFIPCLERHNILNFFDVIVTSSDVGIGKSSPKIYFHAASKLGLSDNECVVFEDLPLALKCAKSAGFYTVGVYDEFNKEDSAQIKKYSDKVISSFLQLI